MPNSQQHRLSSINRPGNAVMNPNNYMHLDYSNPLASRMNFRSIVRSSATGMSAGVPNANRFRIRNLDADKRRMFEEARGQRERYQALVREKAERDFKAKVPKITNDKPVVFVVKGHSGYTPDDIRAVDANGVPYNALSSPPPSSPWRENYIPSPFRVDTLGVYKATYMFTDPDAENGNVATTTRTVHVIEAPTITSAIPAPITTGETYTVSYAVADDAFLRQIAKRSPISIKDKGSGAQLAAGNVIRYDTAGTRTIRYELDYEHGDRLLYGPSLPISTEISVVVNPPTRVEIINPLSEVFTKQESAMQMFPAPDPDAVDAEDAQATASQAASVHFHTDYDSNEIANYDDDYMSSLLKTLAPSVAEDDAESGGDGDSAYVVVDPDMIVNGAVSSGSTIYNQSVTCIDSRGNQHTSPTSTQGDWTVTNNVDTLTSGTYTNEYAYKDPYTSTTVTSTRTVHVVEEPTMTLNGQASLTLVAGQVWNDPSTNITTNIPGHQFTITGDPPVNGSLELTTAGNYTIRYSLTFPGKVGNAITNIHMTREVEVTPQSMPTAKPTLRIDPITTYHIQGKAYVEHGVVCRDSDGAVAPTRSPLIGSATPLGMYDVEYKAVNLRGSTVGSRRVYVVEQPTISLRGSGSMNVYVGQPFIDPGVVTDVSGIYATPIVTTAGSPPVDPRKNLTTTGTYSVRYPLTFVDAYPTFTTPTVTRTVVCAATKAVLQVVPTHVYWQKGITYVDADAGTVTATHATGGIHTAGSVVHTIVGKYTLTYTAKNVDGIPTTATRQVEIISTPTMTLNGQASLSVQVGSVWNDPGYTATDTKGNATRSVSIEGVPPLDLLGRVTTANTYAVKYTLTNTDTPGPHVSPLVLTRTVTVVAPINPPVLTVTPVRVYHRMGDAYTDTGVRATTHQGAAISYTTSIVRTSDRAAVASTGALKVADAGEYLFTYTATHNTVTVTERRWVDVYIDLLDSRNHESGTTITDISSNHPTVSSLKVYTLRGLANNERAHLKGSLDVHNKGLRPFTYCSWIRVHAGQTRGNIVLFKLKCIRLNLEIKSNVANYFDGTLAVRLRASVYGPVWFDPKSTKKHRYGIAYPFIMLDSKRRVWTTMHDSPDLGKWAWVSLQYDGRGHMILSLNGTRFEHAVGIHEDFDSVTYPEVFGHSHFLTNTYPKMDVCNARFYARMLHIHEIQDEYERCVRANLNTELGAYTTHLNVLDAYIDKFKTGTTANEDKALYASLHELRKHSHCALQIKDGANLKSALKIVKKFEDSHGPLFVGSSNLHWLRKIGTLYQPNHGRYGFAPFQHSTGQGSELKTHMLARSMLFFQQLVWDCGIQPNSPYKHYFVSSEYQVSFASQARSLALQTTVEDASWNTAVHLKGQYITVTDTKRTQSIILKVRNRHVNHIPGDYFNQPMPRCTGMWVDRGTISEVTVPETLIGTGCQLCVGAHRNDPSLVEGGHGGGVHSRMDRVVTHFLIDRSTVRVYSPLGGNLYLLCPYGVNVGMIKLTATNVVRARHYRIVNDDVTGFAHETTLAEWGEAKGVAAGGAPTVDIETDHALVHIPSQWIDELVDRYGWLASITGLTTVFSRIQNLAYQYESVCKNVAVFRGIDVSKRGVIDHPMLYTSVDMVMRTSAGGVGWPMVNDPMIRNDQPNYYIVNWCIDNGTMWHELGHMYCNRALAFSNEGESANEVMNIYLLNRTCGYDVDSAYMMRGYGNSCMSLDDGVVDWLKEDMFVNGNYMPYKYAGYQGRSWHKYIDIVALVGWDGFVAYQTAEGEFFDEHMAMSPPQSVDTSDKQRALRMSRSLGMDMAPLLEFWGITDPSPANQTSFRNAVRALIDPLLGTKPSRFVPYGPSFARQDCKLHRCRGVRTLLLYFKSLIPRTNREAIDYVLRSWERCKEGATAESIAVSSRTKGGDKYVNWWVKFYNDDKKTWDSAKIAAIEKRIDDILRDHGLTAEPTAEPGCVACLNNCPIFNPTPVLEPAWAFMPTKYNSYAFADRRLEFSVTEDGDGFILAGVKDHRGALAAGRRPTLHMRLRTQLIFKVNTTTPFYIQYKHDGKLLPAHVWVKRQGITLGNVVFTVSERMSMLYGDRAKGANWYGEILVI